MKKLLGVVIGGILVLGLVSGALAQNSPQDKAQEEAMKKLAQDMAILDLSARLAQEKGVAEELIKRLEAFPTNDPVIANKIKDEWLPAFRDYAKMMDALLRALDKFAQREDLIPQQEFKTEMEKIYSPQIAAHAKKVIEEMQNTGVLEKLLQN